MEAPWNGLGAVKAAAPFRDSIEYQYDSLIPVRNCGDYVCQPIRVGRDGSLWCGQSAGELRTNARNQHRNYSVYLCCAIDWCKPARAAQGCNSGGCRFELYNRRHFDCSSLLVLGGYTLLVFDEQTHSPHRTQPAYDYVVELPDFRKCPSHWRYDAGERYCALGIRFQYRVCLVY